MVRSILFVLVAILVLLALDYYVYRNWRRFVGYREEADRSPTFRWTLPIYRVLMVGMPLTLPVYFLFSNWWDVEPKLARGAFLALWSVYYVPKGLLVLALLVKDGARFVIWLFGWFQEQLRSEDLDDDGETALDLSDMKRASRRHFLREIGWSAASVPFVVVGYSVFRTLYDFEVRRVEVPVPGLPRQLDGLTIGQLSDLHAGSFFSERPMQEAVSLLQAEHPDVIVITGDYVNHDAAEFGLIRASIQQLQADLGVYGCLGNHDHYANVGDVVTQVRDTPVDLLINEHRTLAIDGAQLHLVGVDNTGFYQDFANMNAAVAGLDERPGDDLRLLLAHTPTYWDEHVRPHHPAMDLMLCGHTHGGQLGVEVGPVRYSLARVAYPRWAGLYAEPRPDGGEHFLYVNRGIGTVGPPLRLGIRPEITLLTLRCAA